MTIGLGLCLFIAVQVFLIATACNPAAPGWARGLAVLASFFLWGVAAGCAAVRLLDER